MMVHYSSNAFYYEGGAKNPLKGTYVEVRWYCAKCQFCVLSGSKDFREICNGIHIKTLLSRRLK